ncbi:hypothetical protein OIU74_026696 [Salix koriyanagi]|jgi:hypothetical protein|uniref:Uncharacterized protein n=1 Tax=Salix koriyanagi TaxID=2511006 RepID=A0A9Q0VZK2_9ROSI|nr:hypothetical protein OIU74_026696 [Salix koriyanagi]
MSQASSSQEHYLEQPEKDRYAWIREEIGARRLLSVLFGFFSLKLDWMAAACPLALIHALPRALVSFFFLVSLQSRSVSFSSLLLSFSSHSIYYVQLMFLNHKLK